MSVIERLAIEPAVVAVGQAATVTAVISEEEGGAGQAAVALTWTVEPPTAGEITGGAVSGVGGAVNATFTAGADPVDEVTITLAVTEEEGVSASVDTQVIAEGGNEVIQDLVASLLSLPNDHSLSTDITATVVDGAGLPVAGVTVNWAATAEGELDKTATSTGDDGKASVKASLTELGENAFSVSATLNNGELRNIRINVVEPLLAPVVLNASEEDGYVLDEHDVNFGVSASVEYYAGAAVGDAVTFFWGDIETQFYVDDLLEDLPRHINISDMGGSSLDVGEHLVYYIVATPSGNIRPSSALNIKVLNENGTEATLPAPTIINDNGDQWINIAEASNGVEVEFSYPGMADTDRVTLYWVGYYENGVLVEGGAVALANEDFISITATLIRARVEPDYLFPNNVGYKGRVECYYTVTTAGGVAELSYSAEVGMDTY